MPRLHRIDDGLWGAEHHLVMYGLMHFPGRMTVVRLHDGGLWLCSPVPIDDPLAEELDAIGPVRHIVAPNRLHHLHLKGAMLRYPTAKVWAAPGLPEKRDDLSFDAVLDDAASPPWIADLEHVFLDGSPWMNEVVFFHQASKSLIVTDLLFNFQHAKGWFTRLILRMVRAYRRPGQSRMVRVTTRDKKMFAESLRRVLAWDFDRVVLAHGDVLEHEAKSILASEVAWAIGRPELSAPADHHTEARSA